MSVIRARRITLLFVLSLCFVILSSCGAGGEMSVVGKIVELDSETVVIEPLSSSAELHIPYNSRLDGIERIAFSKDNLDELTFAVGDTVTVNFIDKIQDGDPCRVNAVSWAKFEPSLGEDVSGTEVAGVEIDYPAAIMVDGELFLLDGRRTVEGVSEDSIIGTTTHNEDLPQKNGEANWSSEPMPYAYTEDGVAVYFENEWHLCTPGPKE